MQFGKWITGTMISLSAVLSGCSRDKAAPVMDSALASSANPTPDAAPATVGADASSTSRAAGLPPDLPPPSAGKGSTPAEIDAKIMADPQYPGLWSDKKRSDLNLLLTAYSESLIAATTDGNTNVPEDLFTALQHKKLQDIFVHSSAEQSRTGKLPPDIEKRFSEYLATMKTQPHLGVWSPTKTGGLATDFSALAWWLNPMDASYAREFLAARKSGLVPWYRVKNSWFPYLSSEKAALERLTLITTLTDVETARLDALSANSSAFSDDDVDEAELGDLLSEYGSNEVRADDKYKGKALEFTGVAGEVQRGTIGGITLNVGTGKAFEHPRVHCFFDDSQTEAVKALSKGDRVRLRGRVQGLVMDVLVQHCELVKS